MHKIIAGGLLLFLLGSLAQAENLLRNADFTEVTNVKPLMWLDAPPNNPSITIDTHDAVSGGTAVKIVVPPGQEGTFLLHQVQKLNIPADTAMKLSGWFKTEEYQPVKGKKRQCGIYTAISFADGSSAYPSVGIRPTDGKWQYQELLFSYPKEIIELKYIYLTHYNASGTVKYDRVYFGPWANDDISQERKPSLQIPRIDSVPKLDGILDDPCWQKAARIADFVLFNKDKFAQNATEAYLAYDDENIYIATRSHSSILDPALQMLDTFAAKETARDGSVFRDDSIEVFLSRPDGNYFQFAYNALGAQYDAQKLEKSWDCDWAVKGAIHDGYWVAEAAIPFAALGLEANAGAWFGLNVCRNDRAEKESSSWNNIETSFHDVESFAIATLGQDTLQITAAELPIGLLNLGRHDLSFKVNNANASASECRINIEVTRDKNRNLEEANCSLPPADEAKTTIGVELQTPGDGNYRYILTDWSTGTELFRSPTYHFNTNVILQASNKLNFPGKLELFNNDKKITGQLFYLEKGKNELLIKCTGNGVLSGGIALLDSPDSLPETIIFAGDCTDVTEFKKTILIESSKTFPFERKTGINLEPEVSQHLPLQIFDPAGKELEVLVPAEIDLVDFNVGESGDKERLSVNKALGPEQNINGEIYRNYRYAYTCPASLEKVTETLFLTMPRPTSKAMLNIYFRSKSDSSLETWQRLPVFPLNFVHSGKRPSKLKIELWHSFIGAYTDHQVARLIETFALTGFNEYVERIACYGQDQYIKPLRDNKMRINVEFHTEHQFASLLRKYPTARGRNLNGKASPRMLLQPTFICGPGREEVKNIVSSFVHEYRPDSLIIDMEKSPIVDCDASPAALAEFAKFAGLAESPTAAEILAKYRVEWADYMCLTWSKIAQVINEGVKMADPQAQFAIYSSYQSASNKMKYSIDWNLMRGIVDFAEMGYGRQPSAVREETFKALGDISAATGVLFYSNTPQKTGEVVKNMILRRITDGAKGITFYNWSRLDGIPRAKISEACAILADYEEFFLLNKQPSNAFATEGNIGIDDVVLLTAGPELLLLAFNDRDKAVAGKITLPNCTGMQALNLADGKIGPAAELTLTIKPFDTAVYKIYQ